MAYGVKIFLKTLMNFNAYINGDFLKESIKHLAINYSFHKLSDRKYINEAKLEEK